MKRRNLFIIGAVLAAVAVVVFVSPRPRPVPVEAGARSARIGR